MIEVEGTIVNRNNRSKELLLYKIIAEKDAEIAHLKDLLVLQKNAFEDANREKEEIFTSYKALKSKEYRRYVRRQKARGKQEGGEPDAD